MYTLTTLTISIVWTAYGVAGLFGLQAIPRKHRGRPWTKAYIRCSAVSWLLLGVPWLLLSIFLKDIPANTPAYVPLLYIACALPSLIYSTVFSKRYETALKEAEQNEAEQPDKNQE